MFTRLARFLRDQTGSGMVDWVVLTSSIVGMALVVIMSIGGGVEEVADSTTTAVKSARSAFKS